MTLEKTFDLASGQCLRVRISKHLVTVTVAVPFHTQLYPSGYIRCPRGQVFRLAEQPTRVFFGNAFLDATVEEAEAIVTFVRDRPLHVVSVADAATAGGAPASTIGAGLA